MAVGIASAVTPRWLRERYKENGTLPDVLDRLTAHQFAALFLSDPPADAPDQVELLRATNDRRGKQGLPPVVPAWLFPKNKTARAGKKGG